MGVEFYNNLTILLGRLILRLVEGGHLPAGAFLIVLGWLFGLIRHIVRVIIVIVRATSTEWHAVEHNTQQVHATTAEFFHGTPRLIRASIARIAYQDHAVQTGAQDG